MLHFSDTNIPDVVKSSCAGSRVNGKMCSLVYREQRRSLTTYGPLTNLMNRTPRIQPTLAMGFTAQGIGSSRAVCMTWFELLASAQAGVAATK
jgi:hypothetical protein